MLSRISEMLSLGSDTAVGLSVGSSSIKLVELKKSGRAWRLLHFGMVQLPEDAIVNREIVNQVAVVEGIRSLVQQMRLKNKNICLGVSGTFLITKRMMLDVPNQKELQDQIFWEAEQYLPFDVSEVVMDYQVLSRSKESKTDILLVAMKKAVLDSYMGCIQDSGLRPKIVDVDYFALQNLFEINYPNNPSEAVALVDIGATATKLVVVHNGVPVYTKDATIGGKSLTSEIQRHLNLSVSDAESLKVEGQAGGLPQEVSDLMHIMSENLGGEIKRALDFYNASSTGAPVAYVLLGGGSAKIPGLGKTVEEICGLPVQLINPFNAITYDPQVFSQEYLNAIAQVAAVPIGLALRAGAR